MANTINAKRALPSQEELHKLLTLDASTGRLFWKERPVSMFSETSSHSQDHICRHWNSRYAGKEAFTWTISGYRYGCIEKKKFAAHRVIWKMVNGQEPDEIDHINGDRSDNRIENLRSVDRGENAKNVSRPSSNTSGHVGVIFSKAHGKWHARIKVSGKPYHLGTFESMSEACAARKMAEQKFGFHQNHGRDANLLGD